MKNFKSMFVPAFLGGFLGILAGGFVYYFGGIHNPLYVLFGCIVGLFLGFVYSGSIKISDEAYIKVGDFLDKVCKVLNLFWVKVLNLSKIIFKFVYYSIPLFFKKVFLKVGFFLNKVCCFFTKPFFPEELEDKSKKLIIDSLIFVFFFSLFFLGYYLVLPDYRKIAEENILEGFVFITAVFHLLLLIIYFILTLTEKRMFVYKLRVYQKKGLGKYFFRWTKFYLKSFLVTAIGFSIVLLGFVGGISGFVFICIVVAMPLAFMRAIAKNYLKLFEKRKMLLISTVTIFGAFISYFSFRNLFDEILVVGFIALVTGIVLGSINLVLVEFIKWGANFHSKHFVPKLIEAKGENSDGDYFDMLVDFFAWKPGEYFYKRFGLFLDKIPLSF